MNKDDNKKTHIIVTGKGGGGSGSTDWDDITNKPDFATVATSGSYTDLNDKPTILTQWFGTQAEYDAIVEKDPNVIYNIEGGQPVQSNWNENDSTSLAYIQNRPTIPAMTIQELTFTLEGGVKKTIEFYTAPNYFYVQDISGADNTLSIVKEASSIPTTEIFKSTDRSNWTSMGSTDTTAITATVPANGKLYLKAVTSTLGNNYYNGTKISCTGNYNVGGYLTSLIFGDDFETNTLTGKSEYTFYDLFRNSVNLISAGKLIMPTTSLRRSYSNMFNGCTHLTTAPSLSQTTVNYSCFAEMFNGCTSLTTAPSLPATQLDYYCYQGMFKGCTSLATAPALPATTLTSHCYTDMFNGCTSLTSVTTYANDISANNCLDNWLNGVAATGDFYRLGSASFPSGASGIPSGWTVHTSL